MLIEFRVKNFRSFKDEQVLSMVASSDKELPQNTAEIDNLRLLRTAAIYGANASGKSNLMSAIDVMKRVVLFSVTDKPEDWLIGIKPFRFSVDNEKDAISFEAIFINDGIKYQYGFSIFSHLKKIKDEWLFAFPKGRAQKWFERNLLSDGTTYKWIFGSHLKGDREGIKNKTRDDALFLSVANQWNQEQLKSIYDWFVHRLVMLPTSGVLNRLTGRMLLDAQNESVYKVWKNEILSFIQNADNGIMDILVKTLEAEQENSKLINSPAKWIDIKITHKNLFGEKDILFDIYEESSGTQRLFMLAGPCILAIASGTAVIIDEIESSLHPLLTRNIINYFQNSEINKKGAQLIFATHDTTLLNSELLRRDQIWFAEKDGFSASHLYPLSDYKPRAGEALQKGYLSGRYGAIPILKSFGLE